MGKTVGKLHAMLVEYAKGLPKKAETPRVMMIKDGKIQKSNKKSFKAKGKGKANGKGKDKQVYIPKPKNPKPSAKEHPAKDDTCYHCKEKMDLSPSVYIKDLGGILVSKNNVFYFNAIPSNDIYEIDMHNLVPNVNSMYNVSTKRAKHNLDSTYLWHCRLTYISKKRIEKLQQEGLLKSTDDKSFDQCVSCLSGKMTRATDLLGIIHTDVCGPLKHVSRQGAGYFITFTDDYSRYCYVYLLKHKHEVFETFKVFKNEVENQLGKTIKALRLDRGGEYISQEFIDYLKACGIVQQLTPSYTPQHNVVSKRRNRTLLDMVRSMMNLTTLPLSFWDYALESATRILNMVPTKKVDKTPYELWYGKAPNLSYLKVWGCEALVKRDMPDKLQQRSVKCFFIGYSKEMIGYYFYFPSENKIVVARYGEFFEKNLITQEVEGFEPPQEEEIQIRRSERIRQAPNRLCLNVKAEEHSLGDLNEPTSYKAAMLDSESNKWIRCYECENTIYDGQYGIGPGEAASILEIKIYRDMSKRLIGLGQNAYMDKILKRYKIDNSKRGHIPMQERLDLNKTQGASTPEEVKRMQNVPYASTVGSIMYVVRCTRPDVAFAQNITSRFQQNPGECHWTAVKNILKYLRNTKDMFLVYGGNPEAELRVDCYCNAGFETDVDDMKPLTGYLNYIVAYKAEMEAVWIKKFISGLGRVPTINEPIKMFCDNSAALLIANEPGVQMGARHYHRRYLLKVHTDDNLAYPFTRALPKGKLTQHDRSMGLRLASSFM
ncbi:retrotransposon protein, putative, ty1-copia subclass [Tanacetum coccineum]